MSQRISCVRCRVGLCVRLLITRATALSAASPGAQRDTANRLAAWVQPSLTKPEQKRQVSIAFSLTTNAHYTVYRINSRARGHRLHRGRTQIYLTYNTPTAYIARRWVQSCLERLGNRCVSPALTMCQHFDFLPGAKRITAQKPSP